VDRGPDARRPRGGPLTARSPPPGPEVRHRAQDSGEPPGGRGGGAARPQASGHDGDGAHEDGGGGAEGPEGPEGPEGRQRRGGP